MTLRLTRDKIQWRHFESRTRKIKNALGVVVEKKYDRLLVGWRPAGRPWLESHYTGDAPVMIFMLGDRNVVFTHRENDATVYVNKNAGAQAREYIAFYVNALKAEKHIDATVIEVDDFPTNVITRNSKGRVDSLDKAIALACSRDVGDLGI